MLYIDTHDYIYIYILEI